jgi:hypothetical protein
MLRVSAYRSGETLLLHSEQILQRIAIWDFTALQHPNSTQFDRQQLWRTTLTTGPLFVQSQFKLQRGALKAEMIAHLG